jgi:hypothetical protein
VAAFDRVEALRRRGMKINIPDLAAQDSYLDAVGFGAHLVPYNSDNRRNVGYLMAYESNLVSGLNVVGLRRAGMSMETRMEIKKAFRLIYRMNLNVTEALQAARQQSWSSEAMAFFDFIDQSKKRGICNIQSRGRFNNQEEEN